MAEIKMVYVTCETSASSQLENNNEEELRCHCGSCYCNFAISEAFFTKVIIKPKQIIGTSACSLKEGGGGQVKMQYSLWFSKEDIKKFCYLNNGMSCCAPGEIENNYCCNSVKQVSY